MAFNEKQQRDLEMYQDAFNYYGYWIAAEPIDGMEEVFLYDLWKTLVKIESYASGLRKFHNYRGMSKNLKRALHNDLPRPSFNVEVK
jgi:hypothetical protein